jgi:hypothetical protein
MFGDLLNNLGSNPWVATLQEQLGLKKEEAEATANVAQETVVNEMKNEAGQGNWQGLLGLFQSQGGEDMQQNNIFQNISGGFVKSLISKVGLSEEMANKVASNFLPQFLSKMQEQTKDENGQVSQQNILSNFLGGGNLDGVKDMFSKFF